MKRIHYLLMGLLVSLTIAAVSPSLPPTRIAAGGTITVTTNGVNNFTLGGGGLSAMNQNQFDSTSTNIKSGALTTNLVVHESLGFSTNKVMLTNSVGTARVYLDSSAKIHWTAGAALGGLVDTGVSRDSAGVIEVNSGTAGDKKDITLRNLTASGTLTGNGSGATNLPVYLVAGANVTLTTNSVNNWTVAAAAAGAAMNQNQFDSSSTNIKSGVLVTNLTGYATNTFQSKVGIGGANGAESLKVTGNAEVSGWTDAASVRVDGSTVLDTSSFQLQMGAGGFRSLYLLGNNGEALVMFGGTSSAFPALKRSSAQLQARLADDSADAAFAANDLTLSKTITTPGTTGAQTINKATGRVNIAAAGTSVVVTCSLATANSIIVAVAATADATARVTSVVAASGSFTINTVAVTAETAFNFIVLN